MLYFPAGLYYQFSCTGFWCWFLVCVSWALWLLVNSFILYFYSISIYYYYYYVYNIYVIVFYYFFIIQYMYEVDATDRRQATSCQTCEFCFKLFVLYGTQCVTPPRLAVWWCDRSLVLWAEQDNSQRTSTKHGSHRQLLAVFWLYVTLICSFLHYIAYGLSDTLTDRCREQSIMRLPVGGRVIE